MRIFKLLLILVTLSGCASAPRRQSFDHGADAISVMAYNVENLFDNVHDEGTEDYTYLPLSAKNTLEHKEICAKITSPRYQRECLEFDWSDQAIHRKLTRLAEAILQVNSGRGPDLLIVEEVENIRILKRLNDEYLKHAGYQHVILIEGFDPRGIDVGMLSRLPLIGEPKLHRIPFKARNENDAEWMARSRGILEAHFRLPDGTELVAFGVHFPSGSNPTYWRLQSIEFLNQLIKSQPEDKLVIAGGDFNINSHEDRRHQLYAKQIGKEWLVSHLLGCLQCRGTNYWHTGRSWSFLDALLFRKSMHPQEGKAPWYVDANSIGIPKYSVYQTNQYLSPARFDPKKGEGVSDHWPIFAVLKPRHNSEKEISQPAQKAGN